MNQKHIGYLDGLRGAACLWVLLNHATDLLWQQPHRSSGFLLFALYGLTRYAHLAVTLFILLSGFCLMIPNARSGEAAPAWPFFLRRCRRILPPYFAALLLSIPIWLHFARPGPLSLRADLVSHLLLLQDAALPPFVTIPFCWNEWSINAPLWSIAVEWHIYLFFPALVQLWRQAGARRVLLSSGALFGLLWWTARDTAYAGMNLHYYFLFALGMMTAAVCYSPSYAALRNRLLPHLRFWPLPFAAVLLVLATKGWAWYYPAQAAPVDLLWALACAGLLLRLSLGRGSLGFAAPPLVRLGGFSYSLYLIHMPLLLCASALAARWRPGAGLAGTAGAALMLGVLCPVIVAAAYAFYLAFERPFLVRRKAPVPAVSVDGVIAGLHLAGRQGAGVDRAEIDFAGKPIGGG